MMQKNERDLLEPWLAYHGDLFGLENLYVYDNGSIDPIVIEILNRYEKLGLNIIREFNTSEHFHQKGVFLKKKILELESQNYDFFIPLDCDEFFTLLHTSDNIINCNKNKILEELNAVKGQHAVYKVEFSYPNILEKPNEFLGWEHQKRFFSNHSINYLDHGYHAATGRNGAILLSTRFAYIHYHFKPFSEMVKHSKEKLKPYFDLSKGTDEALKENRLGQYLHMSEDEYKAYLKKFENQRHYTAQYFAERLFAHGIELPFSKPFLKQTA